MKKANIMKNYLISGLLIGTLSIAAGTASAATVDLCAGKTTMDLPDGSSVPMWGYASGGATAGVCDGTITFPGPQISVLAGDASLTITLTNTLLEPTSIVIPGMAMPAGGPTWDDDSTPLNKCAVMKDYPDNCEPDEMAKKVRSFGAETAAGDPVDYSWTDVRPGTFIYHSGTHPQKQVYMGLYGAVTQDAVAATLTTPAEAYPGVEYFNEVVLFYSEIDPVLNAAVEEGTHVTSIDYHANWLLVNGEPYSTDCTENVGGFDVASGYPCDVGTGIGMSQTPNIAAGEANTRTLLRFLSTAGETHVPVLQGMHMTIHAEDGFQYNWQDGATEMGAAPREQYSVMMPPLKTKDAIIVAPAAGRYAVYDGNGYMTNPTPTDDVLDPNAFAVGDPVGGMLRFLEFSSASGQAPVADAGPDQSGSVGTPVAFDGTGSTDDGAIVQYDWDFGDGTVGTGPTPSHTYAFDGLATYPATYTVTLTVMDDTDLIGTDTADVTIAANELPIADPNGPYNGLTDALVTFDGTASYDPDELLYGGTIVSYNWDFGDGNVGIGPTPSHAYTTASAVGVPYIVTLTVTDNAGGVSTAATSTATITVNLPPVADAGPDQSGSEVTPVAFDGTGSSDPEGMPLSYAWDFGDGQFGTGPTPSHSYAVAGLYTVTLTVTDDGGLTATDTADVTIAANQLPTANAGPAQPGLTGDVVTFDGTGSSDFDGTIASYEWDFGDGSPITAENALAEPSHIYAFDALEAYPKTYTVTLTVTDNAGGVSDPVTTDADISAANQPPIAEAGGPYTTSLLADSGFVEFDGTASTDPEGLALSYAWDFGDDNVGTGPTPEHYYAVSTTYVVTLTVTDSGGETDTDTAIVHVVGNQAPVANDDSYGWNPSDGDFQFDPTGNDTDWEDGTVSPRTIVITSPPSRGTATVEPGGILYEPRGNRTGLVTLTYTVKDSQGAVSNEATVTINLAR